MRKLGGVTCSGGRGVQMKGARFQRRRYGLDFRSAPNASKYAGFQRMAEREGFEPSKGFWPLHP